ncbi:MAG: hypothetical protein IKW64_00400 [Clostridia bacterium]|nr:hypothetical protein [Clostridia bacterium]
MRKKFLCLTSAFLVLFASFTAYAKDPKLIYTDYKMYTARIFVCDTANKKAVLVNVAPIKNPYTLNQAPYLEYQALPVNTENVIGSKGQKLSLETVNGYLLDSQVSVLVGKNAYGYKIVYMQFR